VLFIGSPYPAGSAIGMLFAPPYQAAFQESFGELRKGTTLMLDYHPMKRLSGTRRDYDRMVTTICRECAVGCGLCAYVSEGRIADVQGDETNPVSKGRLCAHGTAFVRDLYSQARIASPANRKSLQAEYEQLEGWEEALDLLADRLKKIRDQHGPNSLLIDCDPAAGLDFNYGAMRFAALWGTPYVFSPFDEPGDSHPDGVPNAPDGPAYNWIYSRCLFIIGADPASTHPVAFRWILEAQKNGTKILVADTRFTKTMSKADSALRIRPDTANFLGIALMKALLDEELCDLETISERFIAAESWQDSFERISMEAEAETIGVPSLRLKEAANLLSKQGPVQLITGKRLSHLPDYGIWRTMATAMGWTGKKGGGWYPLDSGRPPVSRSANVQSGASEGLTEGIQSDSPTSIDEYSKCVEVGLIDPPRAVICSGNVLDKLPLQLTQVGEDTPFTVYFGLLANEAAKLAHMVFPAQAWPERDGLFFSDDRAIQWGQRIVEPPAEARSGLDFWIGLASRFGWEDSFPWTSNDGTADHEAFYDWLLNENPATRGCTAEIIRNSCERGEFVYWPFEREGALRAAPVPLVGTSANMIPTPARAAEQPSDEPDELYPLHLEVSDAVFRKAISAENGALKNGHVVQINPDTARALGVQTGDDVVVHEPARVTEVRAWVTRMVPRWLVYLQAGSHEKRVLVRKKGQSSQEALSILRKLLS
jgi:anaerobic selenocysteine-containing dehydrogenase